MDHALRHLIPYFLFVEWGSPIHFTTWPTIIQSLPSFNTLTGWRWPS